MRALGLLALLMLGCGKGTPETGDTGDAAPTETGAESDSLPPTDSEPDSASDSADSDPRADEDKDGWDAAFDCDDEDPTKYPGADELCNGEDDDCDKFIDEAPVDPSTWWVDKDGDGYGGSTTAQACEPPGGYVANSDDCDDSFASVYPGADELCDGRDNDCDTQIDEDPVDPSTWYPDGDGDGYGAEVEGLEACASKEPTDVTEPGDCDDADPSVFPGAKEICGDGLDQDCDGVDPPC